MTMSDIPSEQDLQNDPAQPWVHLVCGEGHCVWAGPAVLASKYHQSACPYCETYDDEDREPLFAIPARNIHDAVLAERAACFAIAQKLVDYHRDSIDEEMKRGGASPWGRGDSYLLVLLGENSKHIAEQIAKQIEARTLEEAGREGKASLEDRQKTSPAVRE
jgi:hypothetical protein